MAMLRKNTKGSTITPQSLPGRLAVDRERLLDVAEYCVHDADQVEKDRASWAPAFWLVAAHGGAGTSTLSQMWAPAGDAGNLFPALDASPLVVIVCRPSKTGLEAAHRAVLQVLADQAGQCQLLGVVCVADSAGKLPKPLAQKLRVIEDITKVWNVPYMQALRIADIEDLAVWNPDDPPTEKSKKKQSVTTAVPPIIATVGREIFTAAVAKHQEDWT